MKFVENIIYLTLRSWRIKYEKDGLNGLESNTEKLIGENKRISVRKVKLSKKNLNLII